MKKTSCDFSCMVPTINMEENVISQLITATRQKNFEQLVLIAQVRINNSKVDFHCSKLITDPDSEINIREDEVPIFLKILSDSEYKQPATNEIDAMKEAFYEMIDETSNHYNANNIYSLISDASYINNQLNVRISLFYPKSSIEIEEIGSSNAPTVSSILGATYRFPKDKKVKDPNSIYAIYYGINGIKDPRIYSLSYSIYLQQHKKINAAFNNKLYRITFHENEEFELLSTTFCISKASSITTRFNHSKRTTSNNESNINSYLNEKDNMNPNLREDNENHNNKAVFTIPREFVESMKEMKEEIEQLREEMKEKEQYFKTTLEQHDQEIKTLLQTILTEVSKKTNNQEKSKMFSHHQISRKPVIPLEIAITSSFENQSTSEFQQIQPKQKQVSHSKSENINIQGQQQTNFVQNQTSSQNKLYTINSNNSIRSNNSINSSNSTEQTQQIERQHPKYSINMQTSFEKRRSTTKDPINTSAPTISSNKRSSQNSITTTNSNNSITSNNKISTSTSINNTSNNNNSKVSINNSKYLNNNSSNMNSRKSKTSAINIENRPDNDDFSTKYSKQSTKYSNQLFNEPSFDISTHIPDSLAESPSKRENTAIPSDFSFLLNNESMDTNKFFEVIGMSKNP